MKENFEMFCNAVALLYHEARNVRHLIREGYVDKGPWRVLLSLPVNRDEAWQQISIFRNMAKQTHCVTDVISVFEQKFRISISDLKFLFGNQNWRHARMYGGNAWKSIADLTIRLANAIDSNDLEMTIKLTDDLKASKHNTGSFMEKLTKLDAAIAKGYNNTH